MLMERKEILSEVHRWAERIINVEQLGDITDDEAEMVLDFIADNMQGYNNDYKFILKTEILNSLRVLLGERKVDIHKWWQKDRPLTTPMKGILNSIQKKFDLQTDIEYILSRLRALYPFAGTYTIYICPVDVFDRICVSDSDKGSCFRSDRTNRGHYEFLETIKRKGKSKYLLIDDGEELSRAWMIDNENVSCIFNVYGTKASLHTLKYPLAKGIEMYKRYRVRFSLEESESLPVYTNAGVLVIYNIEKIANAKIGLSKLKENTYGKCYRCGNDINLPEATPVEGNIVCYPCSEEDFTECYSCERRLNADEVYWYNDYPYCDACFYDFADYCYSCGDAYHYRHLHRGADDNYYCEYCFNEIFVSCSACGEPVEKDNVYRVDEGYYCEECVEEYFEVCEKCGEMVDKDDITEIEKGRYCSDCYEELFVECCSCNEIIRKEDANEVYAGFYTYTYYCDDCFDKKFIECSKCGYYIEKEKIVYVNNEPICESCAKEIRKEIA